MYTSKTTDLAAELSTGTSLVMRDGAVQEPASTRSDGSRKRPFASAFRAAFDESSQSFGIENENAFFSKREGLQPTTDHENENEDENEDENSTSEKLTALAQTVGACAVASVDLFSTIIFHSTKTVFSFVSTTYQENVQQNKRRRINIEPSMMNTPSVKERKVPAADLFKDATESLRVAPTPTPVSIKKLVALPPKPGSFNWIHETPTVKKTRFAEFAATPSRPTRSYYPGTPMDIDTTFDLQTPQKQIMTPVVPKTFKPAVTPSFNPKAYTSVVPDSPLGQEPNFKAQKMLEGLRRHKIGILNRVSTALERPRSSRHSSVHGGGHAPSTESPRQSGVLFSSPKISRAFQFNDRRLDSAGPLRYPQSWANLPRVELPEEAPTREIYHSLYMDVVAQRKKMDKHLEEIRIADEKERARKEAIGVPLLDPEAVDQVEQLWSRRDEGTKLVFAYRIDISVYDLRTLRDRQWLNDNVIDFYLSMVSERSKNSRGSLPACFAFSTHFFSTLQSRGYSSVARWAKRKGIDVTKQDFIFVPINRHNTHWCLAVVNNRDRRFEFYDSMNGAGTAALDLLRDYMYQQTADTSPGANRAEMGYDKYAIFSTLPCPQQQNSYDCGVFVSKMVEVLSRDMDIMSFSQQDMPNIRRRMAYEITTQHLLT